MKKQQDEGIRTYAPFPPKGGRPQVQPVSPETRRDCQTTQKWIWKRARAGRGGPVLRGL